MLVTLCQKCYSCKLHDKFSYFPRFFTTLHLLFSTFPAGLFPTDVSSAMPFSVSDFPFVYKLTDTRLACTCGANVLKVMETTFEKFLNLNFGIGLQLRHPQYCELLSPV